MARTIELTFTSEDLTKMQERLETDRAGHPVRTQIEAALGYLAQWAQDSDRYAHCVISMSSNNTEFVACYYRDADLPGMTYAIGAVWHGERFGFHS